METDYSEFAEQAFDNILDALESIKLNCITILTGDNGSGKSLIRKVLHQQLKKENNDELVKVASTSMDMRTGLHSELGGGGVFKRDMEWVSTSGNSIHFVQALLNSTKDRYIVIDEPEIGMGLSMQKSFGHWLNSRLPEVMENNFGVMVITHSKELVKELSTDHNFVNIQKKTESEWLAAEPELIDLDEWDKQSNALFKLLQTKLK